VTSLRPLACAAVLLLAAPLEAQFIGDALASAGFAEMEGDVAGYGLSALTDTRGPRAVDNVSTPQYSTNVSEVVQPGMPMPTGTGQSGSSNTGTTTSVPSSNTTTPNLPPMTGGGYTIAGGGTRYTPEDAAQWKASFLPVGSKVNSLPPDHETIQDTLRYSRGVFYRQEGAVWSVVPAPAGVRVSARPAAASTIALNDATYFYYNGAFFVLNRDNSAKVVEAPRGAIVTSIPDTAVKQDRNGQPCYVYGATCFKPSFRGSNLVYVVS
jgi:hypothetical protein